MTRAKIHAKIHALSAALAASLFSVALPALAQDPPPPPPPPPAVAPPPAATSVPPPMQAMAAPKAIDDMTGSLGFGVGVTAGTSLIIPGGTVAVKYWLSDTLSLVPALNFQLTKPAATGSTTSWNFNPEAVVLFVPFRSTSTRFSLGGGLGVGLSKIAPATNTAVHIYVPIQAGVEHFFTRWYSMGIAARSNLIDYQKDNAFSVDLSTTTFVGSLFFYTD
jgi:hypothetical protein